MQLKTKTILVLALCLYGAMPTFAQQKNVVSAINYLGYYNKDKDVNDLIEAKKYIDLATLDAETSSKAKTWANRAEIYMNLHNSKDAKVVDLKKGALDEATKAYSQTLKLDEKGNFPQAKQGLKVCAIIASNAGIEHFKNQRYPEALENFEKAIQINESQQLVDSNAIYNAGLSAEKSQNFDKAIQYFQKAIDIKYGGDADGPLLYSLLAEGYLKKGDKDKYIGTIQKGRAAYSNDKQLILSELNYFIEAGRYKEAITNLELAMAKEPNNEIYPFNIGVIYDNMANPGEGKTAPSEKEFNEFVDKAEASYKKALEINPNYFDALYNIGALYFNRAVKQSEIVNNIKDNAKFKIESAKVDEIFKKSLPYLEKGEEIRTNDVKTYKDLISTLQKLYLMTEQTEKSVACKSRLAGGPNGIKIGDEIGVIEEKLGKALKTDSKKGKYYNTDVLDYPEYTLYMDGGYLTKWVKK
ncbi:MAG TPA: tetratricopeptide repeat protein [Bacteroidia bacterium]|nr:tetratricopeptide repeat protein [Bacteroidia bacterium]